MLTAFGKISMTFGLLTLGVLPKNLGGWVAISDDGARIPLSLVSGQRVQTDRDGRFDVAVSDNAEGVIYVFRDSTTTNPRRSVFRYSKNLLQVTDCVATPITIVL